MLCVQTQHDGPSLLFTLDVLKNALLLIREPPSSLGALCIEAGSCLFAGFSLDHADVRIEADVNTFDARISSSFSS